MARFKNIAGRALRVEIGDIAYAIAEDGVVELPSRFDYVVAARGLKLEATDEPAQGVTRESLLPPPAAAADLSGHEREGFLSAWRGATSQRDRNTLFDALQKRLAELAQGADEEPEAEPGEAADEAPSVAAEPEDIDAQIAAAARASGRSARRRGRE